ncbi:hypothetical protein PPE_05615 [Paenibacillus polymyxa E681]|nr:hypothetical protein PPE_05615 [Paenibacillus polymyxa E681]
MDKTSFGLNLVYSTLYHTFVASISWKILNICIIQPLDILSKRIHNPQMHFGLSIFINKPRQRWHIIMNGYDTNICTGNLQELKPASMVFLYSGKSPLSSELIILHFVNLSKKHLLDLFLPVRAVLQSTD